MKIQLALVFFAGLLCLTTTTIARSQTDDSQPSSSKAAEQIQKWVSELDSDHFFARRKATEKLILAGKSAVTPVVHAVENGSLETVSRGIFILREMATSLNIENEEEAYLGLESIARQKMTLAARRAQATLSAIGAVRQERAKAHLEKIGAVITEGSVLISQRIPKSYNNIILGARWSGTVQDLRHIKWVVGRQQSDIALFRQPGAWLITLDGKSITNDYLNALKDVEGIIALKMRKTRIDADGLKHLRGFEDLRYLEILYNPLGPGAADHLAALKDVLRMRLFGTKLTQNDLQNLNTALQCDIDFRAGAFLGISCQPQAPCRISSVSPDTAAAAADLRTDDVIVSYNGNRVKDFDELVKQIGANSPGDEVTLEIDRRGEKRQVVVTLGEWD